MGDIIDFCQKIIADDNFEGVFVPQNNDSNISINKRKSNIKAKEAKDIIIPLNSKGENINFNQLKNSKKNINNKEENKKVNINRNGCISVINDFVSSMNKMNKMIETLENKNKILEDEKREMKKENDKLLEEIKTYKDTLSKFRNLPSSQNGKEENGNNSQNLKDNDENDNDGKVKIIFLFKNKKNGNEGDSKESREEIIGYKYEMFVEVKLRLLNLKHLGPTDIKACYYNSKEINDWYTLEELNIADNTYVICEYA